MEGFLEEPSHLPQGEAASQVGRFSGQKAQLGEEPADKSMVSQVIRGRR
jgi:hypothetical protein